MNVLGQFFVIFIINITMLSSGVSSMNILRRQRRQFDNFDYDQNFDPDINRFSFGQPGASDFVFPEDDNSITRRQTQQQQQQQPFQQTNELIFSSNGPRTPTPDTSSNNPTSAPNVVYINNRPTVATMAPFLSARTTQSPQFLSCYNSCQTTPEYNPICGSNMQLYFNEQKFNCARSCGADVQIVRRGSCQGLFPMMRG